VFHPNGQFSMMHIIIYLNSSLCLNQRTIHTNLIEYKVITFIFSCIDFMLC